MRERERERQRYAYVVSNTNTKVAAPAQRVPRGGRRLGHNLTLIIVYWNK